MNNLTFIKLKIPRLIPKELIESVKGRTFTTERFYEYQENNVSNPYNYLYALVNEEKKIEGYLWAEMNALDGSLFVNTFSVSKSYWHKGDTIKTALEFVRGLYLETGAEMVFWVTQNERFFSKKGLKRSKSFLMEYNELSPE